jgi:hypothetical protein
MALQVADANGIARNLPEWIDNTYRYAGSITAAQGASAGKDLLLITGASTGKTRILKAKFSLVGAGTASAAAGNGIQMGRVVAAPTGQTNVAVAAVAHDPDAAAAASACAITPSTTQTAGTSFTVLGSDVLSISLLSTGGDKDQADRCEIPCGPEAMQQAVIVGAGKFVTFRNVAALPTSSVLYFDIMVSEATS